MEKTIHVRNVFSLVVPFKADVTATVKVDDSNSNLGFTITLPNSPTPCHYRLNMYSDFKRAPVAKRTENNFNSLLQWAKKAPVNFKKINDSASIEAIELNLRIGPGFDFRKVPKRFVRFELECFSSGVLQSRCSSKLYQVLSKRRTALPSLSQVVIPLVWQDSDTSHLDAELHQLLLCMAASEAIAEESQSASSTSAPLIASSSLELSDTSVTDTSGESSNEDETLVAPTHPIARHLNSSSQPMVFNSPHDSSEISSSSYSEVVGREIDRRANDNYMMLYNGNAEVVGNFRALNFYKASDINLKEEVRLLMEDNDPRGVVLQIDGVSYKFKPGTTHSTQRRFVGYIAQQIESVVPEAVQLIDGVLHVDYESLIPYLSESIRQNFSDIGGIRSEQDRIKAVVDMLFNDFIKHKLKNRRGAEISLDKPKQQEQTSKWRIFAYILLSIVCTSITVVIGIYFSNQIHLTPAPTPIPTTPLPSNPPPSTLEDDRKVLVDLFVATYGENWNIPNLDPGKSPWLSNDTICNWVGVTCHHNTVTRLTLPSCGLSGRLPYSIGNLKSLTCLDLAANMLQGTLPPSIGNLQWLTYMNLKDNQLTGSFSDWIGNLTELTFLDLSSNSLSGTIPESIGNLKALTGLHIDRNQLSGTIPNSITNLKALSHLFLNVNELTGTIPESIGDMESLIVVQIGWNNLTGTIPKSISQLNQLEAFDLPNNQHLSGTIPDLPQSIKGISLLNCNLTGTIPESMATLPGLLSVDLATNRLQGTIPIFQSEKLYYLVLAQNRLEGTLPEFVSTKLMNLNVAHNFIQGTIESLKHLRLINLVLSDNAFTGDVSLQTLILNNLFLDNNQFTSFDNSMSEPNAALECLADHNPFQCPIPNWVRRTCLATCE